jgi:hypothetical protein
MTTNLRSRAYASVEIGTLTAVEKAACDAAHRTGARNAHHLEADAEGWVSDWRNRMRDHLSTDPYIAGWF